MIDVPPSDDGTVLGGKMMTAITPDTARFTIERLAPLIRDATWTAHPHADRI